MSIKNNTTSLQSLLDVVNALPEAGAGGDVELPTLTNEGSASDLLSGKQLIDQDGNAITGTFSIDEELSAQDDLITQIQSAVDSLPEAGSGGIATCTVTLKYSSLPIMSYFATAFTESDGISPLVNTQSSGSQIILSNIVCGSVITLGTAMPILFGYNTTNGAELVYQANTLCVFSIPQQPNGDIIITVRDDD